MAILKGNEAHELNREIFKEEDERRTRRLAEAKAKAAARGKEPFDLDALEKLCDTSVDGVVEPRERRVERYERAYYVQHPSMMTIAELAARIREASKW